MRAAATKRKRPLMASLFSRAKRTNTSTGPQPENDVRALRPYPAASEHPTPAVDAEARTYEGRPLDRPGEDIEDQGDRKSVV